MSFPDRPMNSVCPKEERKVSRKPAVSQRPLLRMKATFSRTVLRMLGSLAQRRRRETGHDFRRQKFAIIDPILRRFTEALTLQDQKGRLGRIKQRIQSLCCLVANVSRSEKRRVGKEGGDSS